MGFRHLFVCLGPRVRGVLLFRYENLPGYLIIDLFEFYSMIFQGWGVSIYSIWFYYLSDATFQPGLSHWKIPGSADPHRWYLFGGEKWKHGVSNMVFLEMMAPFDSYFCFFWKDRLPWVRDRTKWWISHCDYWKVFPYSQLQIVPYAQAQQRIPYRYNIDTIILIWYITGRQDPMVCLQG